MEAIDGCHLCGRHCPARRSGKNPRPGFCGALEAVGVSQAVIHHGEEPPISGSPPGGSGTIFFTGCNLSCVFCQNHEISQVPGAGDLIGVDRLVAIMFDLRRLGAYNINLVSPTPYAFQVAQALSKAKTGGLNLPIVYNTGGYDSDEAIDMLDGLVDVYLPDAKLGAACGGPQGEFDALSQDLFGVPDYPARNARAIGRMLAQVGHLRVDGRGLATRGVLVRHLVLPDNLARTDRVLSWIKGGLGPETWLSLMAQYYPMNRVRPGRNPGFPKYPGLGRALTEREYGRCLEMVLALDLPNTFVQELGSASDYLPDFAKPGIFS
jgi:putative pyruvate formate lyase activating enzyme